MSRKGKRPSLPPNLEIGLLLLERGQHFHSGGKTEGMLSEKISSIFQRLRDEKIDWVMVGAEAVNLYIARPRATVDVDIVVRQKHVRKAKRVLKETCQALEDTEVHFRMLVSAEPNRLELDVIRSESHALFEEALNRKVMFDDVPVPSLEALLALKYFSLVSPWRAPEDKRMDTADFGRAYKENRPRIDRTLLIELASRAHQSAPREFPEFLDAIEHDRPIQI